MDVKFRPGWFEVDTDGLALAVLPLVIFVASTSAILVEASEAPSSVKVTYRLVFATGGFLLLSLISYREHFRRFSLRDLLLTSVTGVILGFHYLIWFESLDWTTVAASTTLAQTQAIFVVVLAYVFLREPVTSGTLIGVTFALVGVAVMSMGGLVIANFFHGENPVYGNFLATVAGLLFAGYLVVGRSVRQRVAAIPFVTVVHVFAMVTAFLVAVGGGADVGLGSYPPREWALFVAMGLGPSIIAQGLSNWTLKYVPSTKVSVAYLGVPVSSSILALLIFAQMIGVGTLIGGTLVLVGIYITIRLGAYSGPGQT